uniref:Uncharacterized protein n=1 Tax=Vitis vinifera TaxID=29760 RepID=F6HQJ7_VITVI
MRRFDIECIDCIDCSIAHFDCLRAGFLVEYQFPALQNVDFV